MAHGKTKERSRKTGKKPQTSNGLWIDSERLPTALAKRKHDSAPFAFAAAALSRPPDNDPQAHYLSLAERVLNPGEASDEEALEVDISNHNTRV
ncbi:MAG TPA: hypothetical protein VFQ00_08190 [Terriglobales bacterium]|nr:hypothetical protein [Terriglobales bacterium]